MKTLCNTKRFYAIYLCLLLNIIFPPFHLAINNLDQSIHVHRFLHCLGSSTALWTPPALSGWESPSQLKTSSWKPGESNTLCNVSVTYFCNFLWTITNQTSKLELIWFYPLCLNGCSLTVHGSVSPWPAALALHALLLRSHWSSETLFLSLTHVCQICHT